MKHTIGRVFLALTASALAVPAGAAPGESLRLPQIASGPSRPVTVDDIVRRRIVDTLTLSPDRERFAIFVRQARPEQNDFVSGWFVGSVAGGTLVQVGDGGELLPLVMYTGHQPGMVSGGRALWSPDGQWIAYALRRDGEVQLWRSRTDGSRQEQLTRAPGDVREFAWSGDGRLIYFRTERPRAALREEEERLRRTGLRWREDLWQFTDLMAPALIRPRPDDPILFTLTVDGLGVRPATSAEQQDFSAWQAQAAPPVTPPDADHRECAEASGGELICILATASRPDRLVAANASTGASREIADVNPEYRNLRLGRVERIEWETPRYAWNAPSGPLHDLYPARTHGYIIYPPDFVPGRRYPLFIDPYIADGFDPLGREHALLAYATSGMIVLRSAFPLPSDEARRRLGGGMMRTLYSPELGFPHMTMLMESTLVALDALVARGLVDPARVGIGGVSHGTFVPFYMMQHHDRITAISVSSPTWGFLQYYSGTRPLPAEAGESIFPSPEGEGLETWRAVDIADHLDEVEAPILMNLAAQETSAMIRLIRLLSDAGLPHDVYVFPDETHLKWKPAHIEAIMRRNLDWFRFWLQDFEDADPAKAEQYARWRHLRRLQCLNRRSLRRYCDAARGRESEPLTASPDPRRVLSATPPARSFRGLLLDRTPP